MSRPIIVASICHGDDDRSNPTHRRVRIELHKDADGKYVWRTAAGEDCCIAPQRSVRDAMIAAVQAWGADVWDLRGKWMSSLSAPKHCNVP